MKVEDELKATDSTGVSIYRSSDEAKDSKMQPFDIEQNGEDEGETSAFLNETSDKRAAAPPAAIAAAAAGSPEESFQARSIKLALCFVGLQVSYITWGVLQEKVMTRAYSSGDMFPSATFLVFGNRAIAIWVALALVYYPQLRHGARLEKKAPLVWYAPCSLSNVLSSWAQYQCLKYVTFPVQVVSKSCKIIPVMLVGKFVHGKSYPIAEYLEALVITIGVSLFTLSEKQDPGKGAAESTTLGIMLLAFYLCCDSFTSQWQSKVYEKYSVNQFQMMAGVNTCSVFFTLATLLKTGEFFQTLTFMADNPEAVSHVLVLSITSCTGQLFIFYTIKKFGPVIFTIIMTTRQMLSMVLSCFLFGHALGLLAVAGAIVVFATLGYRIRRQYLAKQSKGGGRR